MSNSTSTAMMCRLPTSCVDLGFIPLFVCLCCVCTVFTIYQTASLPFCSAILSATSKRCCDLAMKRARVTAENVFFLKVSRRSFHIATTQTVLQFHFDTHSRTSAVVQIITGPDAVDQCTPWTGHGSGPRWPLQSPRLSFLLFVSFPSFRRDNHSFFSAQETHSRSTSGQQCTASLPFKERIIPQFLSIKRDAVPL